MKVFDAIKEMRILSAQDKPFSFSFMSFSKTKQISNGIVNVNRGLLRRRPAIDNSKNKFEPFFENYYDVDLQEYRRFWQMLLISFNNQSVELL